jgi:hypothetical protein
MRSSFLARRDRYNAQSHWREQQRRYSDNLILPRWNSRNVDELDDVRALLRPLAATSPFAANQAEEDYVA